MKKKKEEKQESPAAQEPRVNGQEPAPVAPDRKTVAELFKASGTRAYFLPAFCVHAKVTVDQKISARDFEKKLKAFLEHKTT